MFSSVCPCWMELSKSSITHISAVTWQRHRNHSARKTKTEWDISDPTRSLTVMACLGCIPLRFAFSQWHKSQFLLDWISDSDQTWSECLKSKRLSSAGPVLCSVWKKKFLDECPESSITLNISAITSRSMDFYFEKFLTSEMRAFSAVLPHPAYQNLTQAANL